MQLTNRKPFIALIAAILLVLIVGAPVAANRRAQFPILSMGDRGADVAALQHLLRARGRTLAANGYFGSETRSALISLQPSVGVKASGIASVSTWEALVPTLSQGSSGEAVIALKGQLNAKRGASLGSGSSFDAATASAVRAFQKHMGLAANGVADRTTWRNLIWHYMRPNFGNPALCNYNGGSTRADWGTAAAVAHIESAAGLFRARSGGKLAIGDISFEHGGPISLHQTHQVGLDIDIALIRTDGRQCSNPGISYRSARYDRNDTRLLLSAIRETLGGHLQLIYFNDPVMIGEGLSRKYPNHDDHIHVRLCEPGYAVARYAC